MWAKVYPQPVDTSFDWSGSRLKLFLAVLPTHIQGKVLPIILPGRGEDSQSRRFLGATVPGLVVVSVLRSQGWCESFRL